MQFSISVQETAAFIEISEGSNITVRGIKLDAQSLYKALVDVRGVVIAPGIEVRLDIEHYKIVLEIDGPKALEVMRMLGILPRIVTQEGVLAYLAIAQKVWEEISKDVTPSVGCMNLITKAGEIYKVKMHCAVKLEEELKTLDLPEEKKEALRTYPSHEGYLLALVYRKLLLLEDLDDKTLRELKDGMQIFEVEEGAKNLALIGREGLSKLEIMAMVLILRDNPELSMM